MFHADANKYVPQVNNIIFYAQIRAMWRVWPAALCARRPPLLFVAVPPRSRVFAKGHISLVIMLDSATSAITARQSDRSLHGFLSSKRRDSRQMRERARHPGAGQPLNYNSRDYTARQSFTSSVPLSSKMVILKAFIKAHL